ncbi:hypothetical protein [Haloarcula brevis]|uniref:hypothetical protein n=1 Tax=Haloarcula brevis TaxID=3111453 RepID=UPI00300EEAA3
MSTSGDGNQPIGSKSGIIELVRVVNRIKHISPTDRNREKEFIVRNNADEEKTYIFLPLVDFRLNLEVFDEDETKLNYFPNREVDNLLSELKQVDPDAHENIKNRFGGIKYKLLIQLPEDKPIKPGELRTVKITFGQSEAVKYRRISDPSLFSGWVRNWKRKFFTVPSFVARAKKLSNHTHSELFVVEGPREYSTVAEKSSKHKDRDGFYENGYGKDTRVLSTRLPEATGGDYTWDMKYELLSDRRGLMRLLAVFWEISFFTALLLILAQMLHFTDFISLVFSVSGITYGAIWQTFSAGMISGIIGVVYAVRAEWAERYRILCLIPLLLHILSWTLWYLIP